MYDINRGLLIRGMFGSVDARAALYERMWHLRNGVAARGVRVYDDAALAAGLPPERYGDIVFTIEPAKRPAQGEPDTLVMTTRRAGWRGLLGRNRILWAFFPQTLGPVALQRYGPTGRQLLHVLLKPAASALVVVFFFAALRDHSLAGALVGPLLISFLVNAATTIHMAQPGEGQIQRKLQAWKWGLTATCGLSAFVLLMLRPYGMRPGFLIWGSAVFLAASVAVNWAIWAMLFDRVRTNRLPRLDDEPEVAEDDDGRLFIVPPEPRAAEALARGWLTVQQDEHGTTLFFQGRVCLRLDSGKPEQAFAEFDRRLDEGDKIHELIAEAAVRADYPKAPFVRGDRRGR